MKYTCKRCGYDASQLSNLKKHLSRKEPCEALFCNDSCEDILNSLPGKKMDVRTYVCETCGKEYKDASGLHYHKKKSSCVQKPSIENDSQFKILKDELDELKTLMRDIKISLNTNTCPSININQNASTFINTINTININNFGNERIDYITKEFLDDCLRRSNNGMKNLFKEIHFNVNVPENHNIRVLSKKQNILEKYIDGTWHPCDKNNTLDEMIKKGYRILFQHLQQSTYNDTNISDIDIIDEAAQINQYINNYLIQIMRKDSNIYYELRRDLYMMILDGTLYILGK